MSEFVLDADQRRVVETDGRSTVVVAGAGSGKTEVVARRVERLLGTGHEDAFRVLALSYTVKAADELKDRFRKRLGDVHRRVDTDTFHGFAHSLLRQYGTRIGLPIEPEVLTQNEDRAELLVSWLAESQYPELSKSIDEVFTQLDLARARGTEAQYLDEWRDALASTGALDFPAMLERACELLEDPWSQRNVRRIYEHVIVDEAQNLTAGQYDLLRRVIGEPDGDHLGIMVVGDERQSIVTFAGADPKLISQFEREYRAERIELRRNYRSAQRIVQVGHAISNALDRPTEAGATEYAARGSIRLVEGRDEDHEGRIVADWAASLLSEGLPRAAVALGESARIVPEEIAVLSRSAAGLRYTRECLDKQGIGSASASTAEDWVRTTPAKLVVELVAFKSAPDHRSVQRRMESLLGLGVTDWQDPRKVIADSVWPDLAELIDLDGPMEFMGAAIGLELDERDWGDDAQLLSYATELFLDRTDVVDRTFGNFRQHITRCQRGDALESGVRLLTVHKAQGREFKAIAVVGCNEGQFPDFRAETPEELMTELRTFYVAVTRPSRVLLVTRANRRSTRYGSRVTMPSEFLRLIPESVLER